MQHHFSPKIILACNLIKCVYWNFKHRNVWNSKPNTATSPYNFLWTIITFKYQEKWANWVAGFQRCELNVNIVSRSSLKTILIIFKRPIQNSKRPVWWNHHRLKIDQIQENLHVLKSEETVFDVAIEAGGCKAVKTLLPNIIFDLSEKKIYILCVQI